MDAQEVDGARRRFLTVATTVVGGSGAIVALWPFIASMLPSEKAKALGAPTLADISHVEAGAQVTFFWRGSPIWVLRRTPEMLKTLKSVEGRLADPQCEQAQQPDYCKGETRSIKPEYLVMKGKCTHLGCSPKLHPQAGDVTVGDSQWLGGYFCPCHGSKYDLSGRVFSGMPAPLNMVVPPHHYVNDTLVMIGEDPKSA